MYFKFWWFLRALLYKLFFGKFAIPSYIGRPIFLYNVKHIFIHKNVRIYPNVRLEAHTSDGCIIIEEDVSIAQNVHITSMGQLTIGKSSTILANVFITNIDHEYREIGIHILKQRYLYQKTEIGENCYIGIGASIQAGTILGKQCIVGANSVVKGTFDDFCVIVGAPGRIVKRFDLESEVWLPTNPDGSFKNKIL